jgi:hypothetical protein
MILYFVHRFTDGPHLNWTRRTEGEKELPFQVTRLGQCTHVSKLVSLATCSHTDMSWKESFQQGVSNFKKNKYSEALVLFDEVCLSKVCSIQLTVLIQNAGHFTWL